MRADIIRIYKAVHTWTGILTGMALFIAFYAGALTVFKEPLTRWASAPKSASAVPLSDAQTLITQALRTHPASSKDFTIYLREDEDIAARMGWRVRPQGGDEHDESTVRHYVATLDAQGAAQVSEVQPAGLATLIDTLHRVVGLPVDSDPNRWVMGVVASLYALALVSGVVVLMPSLVKDFFALRVGKNLKRMWLDAHNVIGIVSLPFHVVMALSAVIFAFHDGIYAVQDEVVHHGQRTAASQGPPSGVKPARPRDPATMLPPQALTARAQALSPGFEAHSLQYQNVTGPRAVVRVWGKDATAVSPRARGGFVALDPYSGKVMSRDYLPGQQDTPSLIVSSFFALHMAAFGGTLIQWLYFLLGLAGAWLFYSGNLLWIETRRRKAAPRSDDAPAQRRDTRWMASATVGICLGCVCGISLTIVGGKWLHAHTTNLYAWHQFLYYAAFLGCIVWAFARGGAKAAIHLLCAAAALTLAIPLTSLLAWAIPALGMWTHTSPATLGVDATALAGALCFAWMARATARRVRGGTADSVWSGRSSSTAIAAGPQAATLSAPQG